MTEQTKLLAKAVRMNAEKIAIDFDRAADLGGMCLIVSNSLCNVLHRANIPARLAAGVYPVAHIVYNDDDLNHCWVETNDLFIDLTATQFQIPAKVYIAKCRPKNYQLKRYYKSSREWRHWPVDQKPCRIYTNILERIPEELWARLNVGIKSLTMK